MTSPLRIHQQINIGLVAILLLALMSIYLVIEVKVKPDLTQERQKQISVNQEGLSHLLSAKLEKVTVKQRER